MNPKNSLMAKEEEYEKIFTDFLIRKIAHCDGLLPLQHITGCMSQLNFEVRSAVGTKIADVMRFLREHKDLFYINNNAVSLVNSSASSSLGYESDSGSIESQSNFPHKIASGKGVIVKLFPDYGFIKSKEPVKADVYFHSSTFRKRFDLTSVLYTGALVYFNAEKETKNKFRASKVWEADGNNPQENKIKHKLRKNRETGIYDPLTLSTEGIIQKVFPNLGFIAVNGDENNTVFFYKSRLINYENVIDLTKILSKGDSVEFNAHRSTKPDAKARWEATKVWKKSERMKENTCKPESDQCSIRSSSKQCEIKTQNQGKEMIKNQKGKICPRSHGAVIKFSDNKLADGDSAVYFICGAEVNDIGWEFSEGDDVFFDAVKIKSAPGWKAVLVWTGDKPDIVLPTCLGDFSEFTDEETEEIANSIYTSKSSSYMSTSSSSSLKSLSIKSEPNNLKIGDNSKESNSDSGIVVKNKVRDHQKKMRGTTNSDYSCSNTVSFSPVSESSQQLENECNNEELSLKLEKAVHDPISNWGDSPYPDDDDDFENKLIYRNDDRPIEIQVNQDQCENIKKVLDYAGPEAGNSIEVISENDVLGKKEKINIKESKTEKLKKAATIRSFRDIEGKINKVYSKIAEVKSNNLQNTISFFWKDFYSNGVSVEDLELEDLKQVLKVGDVIHFNYFIIVDDSGKTWQKVSFAWLGSKPNVYNEMSPKDFIKQNNLSVTVKDELDADKMVESKISARKFLTAVDDTPNVVDEVLQTDSCSEDDDSDSFCSVEDSAEYRDTLLPKNVNNLTSRICEILKKDVFAVQSEVDLHSVSEEIIKLVLDSYSKKIDDPLLDLESNKEKLSNICSKCKSNFINIHSQQGQDLESKDSDTQTIITGEIIAQNIFTEC